MITHTPGPWTAAKTQVWPHYRPDLAQDALNIHGGAPQPGFDGNIIATVAVHPHITEQDWVNARMLAAAPELYAALLKAKETIHALHGDVAWAIYALHSPEMKQINAALKKATTP